MKANKSYLLLTCCALLVLGFSACRKKALPLSPDNNPQPIDSSAYFGAVELSFENYVGNDAMVLDGLGYYALANGEQFNIKTYNYYVSNIAFVDEAGNRYKEPESYHLIMQKPASPDPGKVYTDNNFNVAYVPKKKYVAIEFLIGVDSIRNVSGAQSGALDPSFGMFWSWSTGYIMAKLEGTSPQSSSADKTIAYHLGGFKGEYKVLRTVRLDLTNPIDLNLTEASSHVTIKSDAATWFNAARFTGFAMNPVITFEGKVASDIASNYSEMFSVLSVDNH